LIDREHHDRQSMRKLLAILSAAALMALPVATLQSASWGWLVQKTTGSAVYQSAQLRMTPLRKGVILNRGATVRTGTNGKVLLVRDAESVFIGPHSIAAIAAHPTPGMRTTVLLQKGKLDLSVNTKSRPHFSIETPYLVAIVKGTKFQVTSFASRSEVTVKEGRVRVKALASGKYADLDPGQKAVVDRSGNLTLSGKGKLASHKLGVRQSTAASVQKGGTPSTSASNQATGGIGVSAGASTGVGTASAGASVSSGGVGVNAGARIGGASVGVGASVGSGGIGVSGRVGLGGLGLGGGLNLGR
jgi:FecR-like protein